MSSDLTFHYKVSVQVDFTADDLRLMKECADMHYDFGCKTFFDKGKRGHGLRFCFSLPGTYEAVDVFDERMPADRKIDAGCNCEFSDLDRISKILNNAAHLETRERSQKAYELKGKVARLMQALNDEYLRLNGNAA